MATSTHMIIKSIDGKPPVVVFCGERESGKSTAAKGLRDQQGCTLLSFADPIYRMMSALLGVDARTLDKDVSLPELGGKTLREALQTLGTEWGRELVYQDIWLENMRRRLEAALADPNCRGVVVDDCRFWNEYEALQSYNPYTVRVDRPGWHVGQTSHASEADWGQFPVQEILVNDSKTAAEFVDTIPYTLV